MSEFTRLLAVGARKRADVMVPSHEPFAMATPWLVELLDERTGETGRLVAVRADGSGVDLTLTPADQELLDGEVVRFVRTEDAPAPAEVSDVTSAVADGFGHRPLPWSTAARHGAAAVGTGAIALAAASVGAAMLPPGTAWVVLLGIAVALSALAAGTRPLRLGPAAAILTAAGLGVWLAGAVQPGALPTAPGQEWRLPVDYAAGWVILGLGIGVGMGVRGATTAAAVALVPTLALVVAALADATPALVAAIVAVVSIGAVGLVPWLSISASGLAALDDRLSASAEPARVAGFGADRAAWGVSAWTTVALAVPAAVSGAYLAGLGDAWAVWLALAVAVVAALRTRVAPGRVESIALWSATLAIALVVVTAWVPGAALQLVALVGLAVLVVIGATVRPVPHARARLRRLGSLLEWIAVVSLLPLLLGVADLYADLLETFPR